MSYRLCALLGRLRRLWPLFVAVAIVASGSEMVRERQQAADREMRQELLSQAATIAAAISPHEVELLSFTAADEANPQYQRLCAQMRIYAQAMGYHSIYSMAVQGGEIVFGPGSMAEGTPMAVAPGTVYAQPPAELWPILDDYRAGAAGPYTDEFGTFVSAYAPVRESQSGQTMMIVGINVEAAQWDSLVRRAGLPTIWFAVVALALLLGGQLAVRRWRSLPAAAPGAWRHAGAFLVAAWGLLLTSAMAEWTYTAQMREIRATFTQLATAWTLSISEDMNDAQYHELAGLSRFFEGSEEVSASEFHAYTAPLIHSPSVRAWAWAPQVAAADRPAFEAQLRSEGSVSGVWAVDERGARVPALDEAITYPVQYVEHSTGNRDILGFDLGSNPLPRAALEEAARTGLPTATDVIPEIRALGLEQVVLVCQPVLAGSALRGLVLAAVPVGEIWRQAAGTYGETGTLMEVSLLQLEEGATPRLLSSSLLQPTAGDAAYINPPYEPGPAELEMARPLFLSGSTYAIVVRPGAAFGEMTSLWTTWLAAVTGMVLTAAGATTAGFAQEQRARLERQVSERTAALTESEERYRAFIGSTSDPVFLKDSQLRYMVVNDAMAAAFDRPAASLVGRTAGEVLGDGLDPRSAAADEQVLRTGATAMSEVQLNGRLYEARRFPVALSDGTVGVGALARDVTDQRRAEAEAQRHLARLRSVANILQYRAETTQDLLDYALAEAIRLTDSQIGYLYHYYEDRQEFVLNTWSTGVMEQCTIIEPQVIYPLEATGVWGEAVRQGRPIILNDFQSEHPLKRGYPPGHAPLTRFMTVPVMDNGHIVAVVGVANKVAAYDDTDILQLTLLMDAIWKTVAQHQSQARAEHLNQVLSGIRDVNRLIIHAGDARQLLRETCAILVQTRDYRIVMAILTGEPADHFIYAEDALEGPLAMPELTPGLLPPCCLRARAQQGLCVVREQDAFCAECPYRRQAPSLASLAARLGHGEETYGYLVVSLAHGQVADFEEQTLLARMADDLGFALHNMAMRRAKEAAEAAREGLEARLLQAQKMEAVGRLAGGVAHDFNNMLSVISGYAELAVQEVDAASPLAQDLGEIAKAAKRSTELTRQLLTFARRQAVQPHVVDLNAIIGDSERMLRRLVGEDIEIRFAPADGLWPIRIDPSQVDQILANLTVNARDAIPGVGMIDMSTANVYIGEPEASYRGAPAPGEYVTISFRDSGAGMDQETLEHLFEPFFTTKPLGRGTGLGLATVYGIVEQNAGFIEVASEPGRGTIFDIHLPHYRGEDKGAVATVAAAPAGGHETILLVEDERQIVNLCRSYLVAQGYTVLVAERPSEAIALCARHAGAIDLLVTDVVMPDMNGKELSRHIAALKPGIAVLFMSGYTGDVISHQGIVDRDTNFIQKPFELRHLAAKVRATLGQR